MVYQSFGRIDRRRQTTQMDRQRLLVVTENDGHVLDHLK